MLGEPLIRLPSADPLSRFQTRAVSHKHVRENEETALPRSRGFKSLSLLGKRGRPRMIDDTCILSSTECPPVGDLRDIKPDDKPHNEYGLYIMPQSIHYTSGILTSVTSNSLYDTYLQKDAIRFVLFRQLSNGSYCEAFHIDSTPNATMEVCRKLSQYL